MEITRHFTTSVYVVSQNQVLLHLHRSLKLWLPVGGHIDRDELPQEAALREAKEESGLAIEIVHDPLPLLLDERVRVLIPPRYTLLQTINPFHEHIDVVFYARTSQRELQSEDGHADHIRWIALDELDTLAAPENVRYCAREAIKLLRS